MACMAQQRSVKSFLNTYNFHTVQWRQRLQISLIFFFFFTPNATGLLQKSHFNHTVCSQTIMKPKQRQTFTSGVQPLQSLR